MDINLEYYKIFYYTAKQKSVTLAAEKLSISQPAVSQAIKHLEKDLGCALFVRTAKGVRLTKEGEMLFSYVERGCEAILSGEKRLLEMLNLEKGEICIGASDMTLKYYLSPTELFVFFPCHKNVADLFDRDDLKPSLRLHRRAHDSKINPAIRKML